MPTDLYSSHLDNVIVNQKGDIMVTLIFIDLSKAKRGIDETHEGFVGKRINVLNLLALSMCPRQHKAELSAVPSTG